MAEVFTISGPFGAEPTCPPGWGATPAGNCGAPTANCPPSQKIGANCRSVDAMFLQSALRSLGKTVGDASLSGLAVDGFIGPATTAAINKAFTTHIGTGQAPAMFRTGGLGIYATAANIVDLTGYIIGEINRRGGTFKAEPLPKAATVTKTTKTATPATPETPAAQTEAEVAAANTRGWLILAGVVGAGLIVGAVVATLRKPPIVQAQILPAQDRPIVIRREVVFRPRKPGEKSKRRPSQRPAARRTAGFGLCLC